MVTCISCSDFISQIPVNKAVSYGDLQNVLMKRIFLSALHFRINARYKVHYCYCIVAGLVLAGKIMIVLLACNEKFLLYLLSSFTASRMHDDRSGPYQSRM